MKKIKLLSIFLFLTHFLSFGQIPCDTIKFPKFLNNSFQCIWTPYKFDGKVTGTVLQHEPIQGTCGILASASVTIITVDNDTVRIIDLCNNTNFTLGQKVNITPTRVPEYQVHIPSHIFITGTGHKKMSKEEKVKFKKELSTWRTNDFDEIVLKTGWGHISIIVE